MESCVKRLERVTIPASWPKCLGLDSIVLEGGKDGEFACKQNGAGCEAGC